MKFILASPQGYRLEPEFIESVRTEGGAACCRELSDPREAVAAADVVYTDTWVSMGQESEKSDRVKDFAGFQVNAELLAAAPKHAVVMHCLPAYRGYEISDETMEAHAGTIFEEAENRLHFQRTLLSILMGEGGIK
jgi:ornithine carbamoyltransferase